MQKAKTLRSAIENSFPEFSVNPDNLRMIVTNRATIPAADDFSFSVKYTLNIYILNQKNEFAKFETAIINWAKTHAPDKLATIEAREKFMSTNIDIIDHETYHAEIEIELTETIAVTKNPDGTLSGDYMAEPNFNDPFIGDTNVKNLDDENVPLFTDLEIEIIDE